MNTPPSKILLPVDGSAPSLAAVRYALHSYAAWSATFVLVNVQEAASLYEVVVTHDADRLAALKREAGADLLREAEAMLVTAGAEVEIEVAGGVPEHLILELAENYGCDAIVMGATGQDHAPDTGTGLGPVALAVLEHSAIPVTIVRMASAAAESAEDNAENTSAPESP